MACPTCGAPNPDDARFCGACGVVLSKEIPCPRCAAHNAAGNRFCNACGESLRPAPGGDDEASASGQSSAHWARAVSSDPRAYTPRHLAEKILTTRGALEGERKQVTVLFADVKGSMELAEQLDPEEWHRILDRFFTILADGVHRFEGTINQYTGDGVMALFGAPIAHEDHAQRGCYAALHLRDGLRRYADELRVDPGLNFSVRMGLNSGEVVVGKIGDDLRMDYTAQGPTVGLAARMEQLAEPGKVLLTEHTARLVDGFCTLRDLGPARVRGVSEPVRLFELEGVGTMRTRFDVSRARGLSKFVGRTDEMSVLDAALERALAGQGSVVSVVAEAGTGKSRLCHEFVQRCTVRGIEVDSGHGLPHGKMIPLLPVLEALRQLFGITSQDAEVAARQRIAGAIVLLDPALQDSLPLWFDFLGIPDPARPLPRADPEARQRQVISAVQRLIRARSAAGAGVLLFEDLHWVDPASEHLIGKLLDVLPTSRTLLVVNFRPEYHGAWRRRVAAAPPTLHEEIALQPLGPEAIEDLLDALLGAGEHLVALRQLIREQTGGNPFFVEEVVQSLIEDGALVRNGKSMQLAKPVSDMRIPPTVQSILAARIDRLPEGAKQVLHTAAVIGKQFAMPVLQHVVHGAAAASPALDDDLAAALQALDEAELVHPTALYPEAVYTFRHPLTQEVAYHTQLGDRRAQSHAAVARAIEATYTLRADEHSALLAHHWEAAGDPLSAARWHRRAAEWVGQHDRHQMVAHWKRVRALLESVPESPETLALGVQARRQLLVSSAFLGATSEEAEQLFSEGMAMAARLGDAIAPIQLLISRTLRRMFEGAIQESLAALREALRLAEESGNPTLRFLVRVSMETVLIHSGALQEAVQRAEEAEALSGGDADLAADVIGFSPLGVLYANRAHALTYMGRLAEVEPCLRQAMAIADRRHDAELQALVHMFHALFDYFSGDAEGALAHARDAVALAEAVDSAQGRVAAYGFLGTAQVANRNWKEALDALSLSLAGMHETGTGVFLEAPHLAQLALAYLGSGELAAARRAGERSLALARARHTPVHEAQALWLWSQVLRLSQGLDAAAEAEQALRDAEGLVERTSAFAIAPHIHAERAEWARLRGDARAAEDERREAHRRFTAIGATRYASGLV